MVVSSNSEPAYRFRENSQFPPSNAVGCRTLSTVNSFEGHTEQQIDKLRGQRPPSRSPPSHALDRLFNRIKGVPTFLVLGEKVLPGQAGMLDDIDLVHPLQPEPVLEQSSPMLGDEVWRARILPVVDHLVKILGAGIRMIEG